MSDFQLSILNAIRLLLGASFENGAPIRAERLQELAMCVFSQSPPTAIIPASPDSSPSEPSTYCRPESRSPSLSHQSSKPVVPEPVLVHVSEQQDSTPEYPNGDVRYRISIPDGFSSRDCRMVGWAMFVYGSNSSKNITTHHKACLGNYECPVQGCLFSERPRVPRASKTKSSLPLPSDGICPTHGEKVRHLPCEATLKTVLKVDVIEMFHAGFHSHRKPIQIRADINARMRLSQIVLTAPEIRPKSLQIGTATRPSVGSIHPAYNNLSRLAYQRKKILSHKQPTSTIGMLASFEQRIETKIIVSSSFAAEDGHIILMTPFQQQRLSDNHSAVQTDTIEGFVVDTDCPVANVTMTTGFCAVLDRNIPFCISLLMGKTAAHYAAHFKTVFRFMEMPTDLLLWTDSFPGNTCDFSDAERAGFELALRNHCNVATESSINIDQFYKCCSVTFQKNTLASDAERSSG